MLLKVDTKTWIEIPNNSTEEFKKSKIEKYNKEKQDNLNKLKSHRYVAKGTYKKNVIGALYDRRINLTSILKAL